jgi:DNA-binding NarL/FixJ family response regulator
MSQNSLTPDPQRTTPSAQRGSTERASVCLILASHGSVPDAGSLQRLATALAGSRGVSVLVAESEGPLGSSAMETLLAETAGRDAGTAPLTPMAVNRLADALAGLLRNHCVIYEVAAESRTAEGRDGIPLTERQVEVLRLVADGCSIRQIAAALQISPKTVEFHKAHIMQKLNRRSTADLIKYAIEHGLTQV